MKTDLIAYLVHRTPSDFLRIAVERMEAAYFAAHKHVEENCDPPERPRVRGQLRHYYQNQALRVAAKDAGLSNVAAHTDPKGERYSLIASQDIRFGRISVHFRNNLPRPAKHRNVIAAVNSRLEPISLDLFNATASLPTDGLGVLIVTVHPPAGENQSVPKDFLVGIPYSNVKGWHLFEPVASVLAAYHAPVEIEVPDLAWVALKKRLRENE